MIEFEIDQSWTIPNDAPTGFYQVAINVKKPNGERYTDNLALADIFFVYQLRILIPTESHPAIAGDPNDPNPIFVYVTGLPPLEEDLSKMWR